MCREERRRGDNDAGNTAAISDVERRETEMEKMKGAFEDERERMG